MNGWTEWGQGFMLGLLIGGSSVLVLLFLSVVLLSTFALRAEDEGE